MNAETQQMLKLQQADLELKNLHHELDVIPHREQEIHDELNQLKELSGNADAEVKELEKTARNLERDVESLRSKKISLKNKQMEVKTNKEYQAILAEIDFLDKDIFEKEDQILEIMEQSETAQQDAEIKRRKLAESSRHLEQELQRLADSRHFLENEIRTRTENRDSVARELPADVMKLYRKLADSLGGVALSEARDEICQVCHVRLRPQAFEELRSTDRLIQCENCSRILYFNGAS